VSYLGVLLTNRAGLFDISGVRILGLSAGTPMKPSTEQDYHERIVRTLVNVQRHLDDDLELENLASVAAFPGSISRSFPRLVGEWLNEHIRRLRLERAAQK
jgi:transcriptional regulator GlxA family with amidase domain